MKFWLHSSTKLRATTGRQWWSSWVRRTARSLFRKQQPILACQRTRHFQVSYMQSLLNSSLEPSDFSKRTSWQKAFWQPDKVLAGDHCIACCILSQKQLGMADYHAASYDLGSWGASDASGLLMTWTRVTFIWTALQANIIGSIWCMIIASDTCCLLAVLEKEGWTLLSPEILRVWFCLVARDNIFTVYPGQVNWLCCFISFSITAKSP